MSDEEKSPTTGTNPEACACGCVGKMKCSKVFVFALRALIFAVIAYYFAGWTFDFTISTFSRFISMLFMTFFGIISLINIIAGGVYAGKNTN